MKDKSKYRMIADSLRDRIYSGELISGEKFYTRKQLCELYNISLMTAFNVQKLLQDDGLIFSEPGVGFFVNRPEMYRINHPSEPVRKIRMIGSPQAIGKEADFGSQLVKGVREACEKHDLTLNVELVQVLNNPMHIINTSRRLDADEALLVFLHDELLPEVVNLLLSPDVRAVTISRTFPDKPAVLCDIADVVRQILALCERKKVHKVLYAGQCNHWISLRHESVFFEMFERFIQDHDFEYETDFSGNFPQLVKHIKEYEPDAVIFSQDEGALRLRDKYFAAGEKRPVFIGYGDYDAGGKAQKLRYTYWPDGAEMGRRAVEILLKPDINIRPSLYEYVAGKLIERD